MDRMKNSYILEPDAGGSCHDIRFKTENQTISLRNLPNRTDAEYLRALLHRIDVMAKIIAVSCIVLVGAAASLCLWYTVNVSKELGGFELGLTCLAAAVFGFTYAHASVIAARYMIKREPLPTKTCDLNRTNYLVLFRKFTEKLDMASNDAVSKFVTHMYWLAAQSDSVWELLSRIADDKVTFMQLELTPGHSPETIISYKYIDGEGDILNNCICINCNICENMYIKAGLNVLDFSDMTFRLGKKWDDADGKAGSNDGPWERLKSELFMNGYDAIEDFLGYGFNPNEDKDTTENRLEEVYMQMPDEEFGKFLEKYGIE